MDDWVERECICDNGGLFLLVYLQSIFALNDEIPGVARVNCRTTSQCRHESHVMSLMSFSCANRLRWQLY